MAIGAIESKFYAVLLDGLGLDAAALPAQHDRARWPELRAHLAQAFRRRTRDDWCRVFDGADACFAPVLSLAESRAHPHNLARGRTVSIDGVEQPAAAPLFGRTPGTVRHGPPARGSMGRAALTDWSFAPTEIDSLIALGLGLAD